MCAYICHMSKSAWNAIDHEIKRITQNNLVSGYESAIAKDAFDIESLGNEKDPFMILNAIVLFVSERTYQIKELSMIDSYIRDKAILYIPNWRHLVKS